MPVAFISTDGAQGPMEPSTPGPKAVKASGFLHRPLVYQIG